MKPFAFSLGLLLTLGNAAQAASPPPIPSLKTVIPTAVQPFDLAQVRLSDGPERAEQQADRRYLHALDADRLLYNFRKNAGLPAPGRPLGGWEAPDCEVRGHFVGHYLSACALMSRSAGDKELKAKGDYIVAELAKCQRALGGKYLSAFPTSFFDRLEAGRPVWAPYYTIHKIMAGLVDMYQYCGNTQALQVAENMADYFQRRTARLTDVQFDAMMRNEFGGMANVLYDLYAARRRPADLALAHRFDQASFLGPLALRHDDLTGIHANTHLPKILGAARRYELLEDPDYHTVVAYFWDRVANHRSYATGGSNRGEYWGDPDDLAHTLVGNNQETCTTYNILKVTRHLIRWTADPRYADFYERAYFNGILPAQDPQTGMMIYYLPLAAGNVKNWGTPNDSFWCCYGTGVESFAKLNDSIYFHDADGLYVNLYVPSEVNWPQKGVRLTQRTRFPEEPGSTFVVHAARPTQITLHLHVPYWAVGYRVSVNGKPLAV
ncbi:MAG: glycoside hydrolase family 127 protein, partial [Armatimonadetes bacterium]|nr:glycoside hydrolase family 127 protein [Armatimonadota bacterium]